MGREEIRVGIGRDGENGGKKVGRDGLTMGNGREWRRKISKAWDRKFEMKGRKRDIREKGGRTKN